MLQKYFKPAAQLLSGNPVLQLLHIGSLAAGIATAVLIFLAGHTSGPASFTRMPPAIAFLQVQDSSEVQELGKALLIILMFDKAGNPNPRGC